MADNASRLSSLSKEQRDRLLDRLQARRGGAAGIPRREQGADPPAASFAQQRLWFLDQYAPGSPAYNLPCVLRLRGRLDVATLERALGEVVRRHEALRTTFAAVGGKPVQVIAPSPALALEVTDISGLAPGEREAEARRLATREAERPFDLARGPLVRPSLLRLGDEDHVLVVALHHIIADGWSLGILTRELQALYAAFCAGRPSPLPEPPIQYADFAEWQRRWLGEKGLKEQLAYWKERLHGGLFAPGLPLDHPRPAVQTLQGAAWSFLLPRGLSDALRALGQGEGATPFMTLLAAFEALLHRYSGQDDIVVGTPIANRNRAETEGVIGFFVNTLALRTDLGGDPTFRELLRRVRAVALGAYDHQDLPFEELVEALRPARSLSHTPLFQVLFSLQDAPRETLSSAGVTLEPMEIATSTTKFDLTLSMAQTGHGLRGTLEYNTDLFDAATIERMIGHFKTLLAGAAAEPQKRLSELPLLAPEERHQLLVGWNATATDYPRAACVHELFAAEAAKTPGAVALVFGGASLTYGQLNARANQLAHHLRALGVGPETPVGLCAERSLELIVGMLGILKAGGAYVPLDPAYPRERLALMLNDACSPVLLTQERLLAALPAHPAKVVCLDADWPAIAAHDAGNPASGTAPGNLAYVMYTSGSTGTPKGVSVTHRNVVRLVKATNYAAFGPDEVFLQLAPASFDAATFEVWGSLCNGARLVVMPPETPSLPALGQALREHGVTTLWLTAGLFHLMVDERPGDLRGVRQLLAGGDVLSVPCVQRVLRDRRDGALINGYGPTETTTFACTYPMGAGARLGATVPIGRPIANARAYILDKHLEPVPVGVPGELYIGGDGLARGYLNRPDLTAEAFLPSPVAERPGERLYRTGDLARYLHDGAIEFLGRIDFQVKIRGFRIEPGEVEAVLGGHPAVHVAAVVAREDTPGQKRLVAYVAHRPGRAAAKNDLREYLKGRLPEYMVPSAFVALESMPLTPSGKVDRRALPAPGRPGTGREESYAAPRTPVEEVLAAMWAEVLGLERVGIHDDFFEAGGHSLLATQLISRVRDAFQVDLTVRALFEEPTVAGLAQSIAAARGEGEGGGEEASGVRPVPRDGPLPLSYAQQRLWFLDRLEPGTATYNIPFAVRLSGRLDRQALEAALNEIVRRHEVLRTTFRSIDGRPAQVIAPSLTLTLPVVDVDAAPDEREAEARRLALQVARRPFDLQAGPLLRPALYRLEAEEHLLLLSMHHIVADGWSMGVLYRELAALYDANVAGCPSPLPDLPVQYADFAQWQRESLAGDALEAQLAFWRQALAKSPPALELHCDRPRPPVQTFRGATITRRLPRGLGDALKALSRDEGVTPFMTLLAAFKTLLLRYTGQEDVVVGTPIASRNRAEIEPLIGFFVNTLVLRTDLSGDPTFRELLGRVREVAVAAYAHQDLPFERLVDALETVRDLGRSPLFQAMFNLHNAPAPPLALAGLTLELSDLDVGTAKFDVTLAMAEQEAGLVASLEYNADLFDAATAERMLGHFQAILEAVAADPGERLSRLALLDPVERQRLLVAWNQTRRDYPREACVHELFEAQAARTPGATAVTGAAGRLTYAELDRRSSQLAHYLRRLGVGPEVICGIAMERTPDMVAGILGILKAGGAYVALDPAYPRERLQFMLEDAAAPVLVTQRGLLAGLPAHAAHVVCLARDWDEIARQGAESPARPARPAPAARPENLAYLIYTSGSTGRPKGVAIEHRSAVTLLHWARETFTDADIAGVLAATSTCFDLSVFELFAPLCWGGTVILAGNALDLPKLPARDQVTLINTVPTAMAELLRGGGVPPSARVVNLAGEPLPAALAKKIHELGTVERLFNLYGPSEDTTYSTFAAIERGDARSPAIGRPIADTQAYILDRHLEPVPVGVPGELYLAGAGLARGYLARPDLTARGFIPNPFSATPGARMYRTGDLARRRPDGAMEFLGRIDGQVKVRGFRIELGEVEAALIKHPAVRESAVAAREDAPGERRLVAYVVLAADVPPAVVRELREFLTGKLPDYMVPAAFVLLPELPLTPSGKVDRRALPAPDRDRPEIAGFVAPGTPAEETLAAIWAEVLGVARVGVHDNFFELGGDSILSIQIIGRAGQMGLSIAPRDLFQHQTIAELAAVVGRSAAEQADQGPVTGPAPLTPVQHWFFERDLPDPHHWNQALLLAPRERLDPATLEEALRRLVVHHDALRLRFERAAAGWRQSNAAPGEGEDVTLQRVDLSGVDGPGQGAAIAVETARLQARLDLGRGPLVRAALFDLGPARPGRLLLIIHHLAVDGVSWRILLEDLRTAYRQLSQGAGVRLPPKTTSFRSWAEKLHEHAQSPELARELDFWLDDERRRVPRLPVDEPGGQNTEGSARSVVAALDPEKTGALLHEVPAAHRTQINDVLLAALGLAVAAWTQERSLLVDVEGHGREELPGGLDLSRTVGWFTSVFPVLLTLGPSAGPAAGQAAGTSAGPSAGPADVLRAVKERLRAAPNRGIGYGLLRYLRRTAGDAPGPGEPGVVGQALRELPQAEMSFNYLGQFDQALAGSSLFGLAPEPVVSSTSPRGQRRYLVEVSGAVVGGQLRLTWTYSEGVHRRETIEDLAHRYLHELGALIRHCQSPAAGGLAPSDFEDSGLTQDELDRLLARRAKNA